MDVLLAGSDAWYRYHGLFAEAMRTESRHRLGEDLLCAVSLTASQWYEAHGMRAEAVEAALQAQDWSRAADLIESIVGTPNLHEAHEFHTLRRWLEQLPDAVLRQHPVLCLSYAVALLFVCILARITPSPAVFVQIEEALQLAEAGFRAMGNLPGLGVKEALQQPRHGVTATIRDRASGAECTIHAGYMIAADGARAPTRSALGVPTSGRGTLGHLLNILFQADMRDLVRDREFSLCLIEHPKLHGLFASINNADRWVLHLVYEPHKGETPADFPPERCVELLRLVLDLPEIAIEIKSILPWECAERVADGFRPGRIFLAAYCIGPNGDLHDPDKHWQAAAGVGVDGALLVRPDGFIAWRSKGAASEPGQMLDQVLTQVLGHDQHRSA